MNNKLRNKAEESERKKKRKRIPEKYWTTLKMEIYTEREKKCDE